MLKLEVRSGNFRIRIKVDPDAPAVYVTRNGELSEHTPREDQDFHDFVDDIFVALIEGCETMNERLIVANFREIYGTVTQTRRWSRFGKQLGYDE